MNTTFVFSTNIKIGSAHKPELFLPQSWVRSTRPMDIPFTYLPWPQANWSWNMYWIFHTDRLVFFPSLELFLKIPTRETRNLDSSLKDWTAISHLRMKVVCVQNARRDSRIAINFAILYFPTQSRIQHPRYLPKCKLQPPTIFSSIDESTGVSWS